MKNEFKNKIILVTGGTGSIGSEIVKQLLEYKPRQIRVLSRNDSKQYHLLEKLGHPKNVRTLIGDIRDSNRLDLAFENVSSFKLQVSSFTIMIPHKPGTVNELQRVFTSFVILSIS